MVPYHSETEKRERERGNTEKGKEGEIRGGEKGTSGEVASCTVGRDRVVAGLS